MRNPASLCVKWRWAVMLLLLVTGPLFGQSGCQLSGQVVDEQGVAIPFATIRSSDGRKGLYADQHGRFTTTFCSDSLFVSALGYRSVQLRTTTTAMLITLSSSTLQLSAVTVKAKSTGAERSFGYYRALRLPPTLDFSPNTACLLATFVENEVGQTGTIRQLNYRLSARESAILTAYATRLRVLTDSITPQGKHQPGHDLLVQNQVVMIKPTDKHIQYMLDQPVPFPTTGVWVAIESMGYVDRAGVFQQLRAHEFGEHTSARQEGIRLLAPYFAMKKNPSVAGRARLPNASRYTTILGGQAAMFGLTATF